MNFIFDMYVKLTVPWMISMASLIPYGYLFIKYCEPAKILFLSLCLFLFLCLIDVLSGIYVLPAYIVDIRLAF